MLTGISIDVHRPFHGAAERAGIDLLREDVGALAQALMEIDLSERTGPPSPSDPPSTSPTATTIATAPGTRQPGRSGSRSPRRAKTPTCLP